MVQPETVTIVLSCLDSAAIIAVIVRFWLTWNKTARPQVWLVHILLTAAVLLNLVGDVCTSRLMAAERNQLDDHEAPGAKLNLGVLQGKVLTSSSLLYQRWRRVWCIANFVIVITLTNMALPVPLFDNLKLMSAHRLYFGAIFPTIPLCVH